MAVDPNIAARQRQELELRAQQPLSAGVKGGQATGIAQNGTLPEGLFGGAEEAKFDIGDGSKPTDLFGAVKKFDDEADDLGTIRDCMAPKPKADGA